MNIMILILLLTGCKNTIMKKQKDTEVIKFFLPVIYNEQYKDYKMGYFYQYNREYAKEFNLKKFNFNNVVKNCFDVDRSVQKVYYRNIKEYKKNIPYKHESYCGDALNPESITFFDSEGKVIQTESLKEITNYFYTKNTKTEKTIDKTSKKLSVKKYIYNQKLQLVKIIKL